ncbi:DUF58 domain-containing protein [Candidatus Dependentiae bacterium]|nr:DUF58 domain-containing protein [Candidatus Dependentiae bacterium]
MDTSVYAQLKKLQIVSRKISKSSLIGDYASAFKGVGIEFDQLRAYVPGDDVRSIDWKATARTDETMVKTFVQERDRTIIVALDSSSSMFYSSSSQLKYEVASLIAGALGSIALNSHDRFGAILFSSNVDVWIPPARGQGQFSRVIDEISRVSADKTRGTSFENLVSFLMKQKNKKNVFLFVISDFLDEKLPQLAGVSSLVKSYDLTAFSVFDPCEASFPELGIICMQDVETGKMLEIDTRGAAARKNAQISLKRKIDFFRKKGIDYHSFDVTVPVLSELSRFFKERTRRQV